MRVTKIIREYVENTVRESYGKKIDALRNLDKTEEEKKYEEWAVETVERLIEEVIAKAEEHDLKFKVSEWQLSREFRGLDGEELEAKKFEEGLRSIKESLIASLEGGRYKLYSKESIDIDDKIRELRKECEDKIQEILVGLEIGDINKKELDDALAPFKSGE